MDKFTVVLDIKTYVESLIRNGSIPFKAVKVGFIIVDEAKPGTELKTYVDGLIETVSISKEGQVIATKADEKLYIQVTESMASEEVRNRELAPLMKIQDNYEKIVLSLNPGMDNSYDGIKSLNLIEWLIW